MTPADRIPRTTELRPPEGHRPAHRSLNARGGREVTLEREVDRLVARIAELESEKAEVEAFAAVAAHQLVEPLVMTEAYTSMVSDRLSAPEHQQSRADLQALGRTVSRLRLLTESVLHDARSNVHPIDRRPVNVAKVVADCLAVLGPEVEARDARIEVDPLPHAV